MKTADCAFILLASGLSQRFGAPNKLLADLGGKMLIERALENIQALDALRKYVVVSDPAVSDAVSGFGYEIIQNSHPERGQDHARRLGTERANRDGATSVCITLADMPFIDGKHIEAMVAFANDFDIVMSEYAGIRMPPVIFKKSAFERVLSVCGDGAGPFQGVRNVVSFPLTHLQAMDIDTPQDLVAARAFV